MNEKALPMLNNIAKELEQIKATPVPKQDIVSPRIITYEQFSAELSFKAETARARVPPEYRPRIEVQSVIWDSRDHRQESSLGDHFQEISQPADNGGFAQAPPPIAQPFNAAAGLEPAQSYAQKVRLEFKVN